jgi:plasmid stabilization system protein ParE
MKSGYRIVWTEHALEELKQTIEYLEKEWSDKEIQNLAAELEHTLELLAKNPDLFQSSRQRTGVRRAVVATYNNLYYRVLEDAVEIVSFFSNRQNPGKIKW